MNRNNAISFRLFVMDTFSSPNREKAAASTQSPILVSPNEAVIKPKKGKPSFKASSHLSATNEAVWTTRMIETLLNEKTVINSFFLEAQNKQKLGLGWSKITLAVNTDNATKPCVDKVKSKYFNLKASYRRIVEEAKQTSNGRQPKMPDHWDAMVAHF